MSVRIGQKFGLVSFLFLLILSLPMSAQAAPLQCKLLPQLFENYTRFHYTHRAVNEELQHHTVDQFIDAMDPSKTLFLESDLAKLKADLPGAFISMRTGDCSPLDRAAALALTRAKDNEAYVRQFLGKNYKLDDSIQLIIDPAKRGNPKTVAEQQDILRKLVHFQISNYLLTDVKLPEAKKLLIHRYQLMTKRLVDRKPDDLLVSFAESFALALDPHSGYLSQERLEDFQINMRLSLEGIGATLTSDDGFTIVEGTIPGGGAEKSGNIRPKDKIIAVAQDGGKPVSVIDMELRDVVQMIRGKKGTKVTLTLLRQAEKTETFDVTIMRDKIDVKDQAASITYQERQVGDKKIKIGIIELPGFYGGAEEGSRSSYTDMKNLLLEAKREKVDGIVLYLSRNGGGLLDHAVKISGLFLQEGGVVATKDTRGKVQILADEDEDTVYSGPLVVFVSRMSASASEILAGTLKAYNRAIIVGGEHTFGKGTVQSVMDLPQDLGAMTVTIGMFFVADGTTTQHNGVTSDIRFPSLLDEGEFGEKKLDYSLPPQQIPAFLSPDADSKVPADHWQPVDNALIKKLSEKSAVRVAADPKFAEMRKNLDEAKKNEGVVRLADLRKKAVEKKNDDKKNGKDKLARDQEVKEMMAPMISESVNIVTDLVQAESGK
jgi:carboxyl-terminal processing protease